MPKSKNRKQHKQKLNQFKTKTQKMSETNQQQGPMMPPVRSIPVWDNNAKIELTGTEFQVIENSLARLQEMIQVVQSVMSRNIISGEIKLDFQKLNPQTLQYGEMSAEEKAVHEKAFQEQVAAFKEAQAKAEAERATQKPVAEKTEIVTDDDSFITSAGTIDEPIAEEAKVVSMDTTPKGSK